MGIASKKLVQRECTEIPSQDNNIQLYIRKILLL